MRRKKTVLYLLKGKRASERHGVKHRLLLEAKQSCASERLSEEEMNQCGQIENGGVSPLSEVTEFLDLCSFCATAHSLATITPVTQGVPKMTQNKGKTSLAKALAGEFVIFHFFL